MDLITETPDKLKPLLDAMEEAGFNYRLYKHDGEVVCLDADYFIEFGKFSPAGNDWWESAYFKDADDLKEQIHICYENFDVDEEVELWIEGRGKHGVPSSIRTLVEDAEWKEEELKKLQEEVCDIEI